VKRFTWLVLAIVVAFVGATFVDHCAPGTDDDCPPVCHLACADGCAVAPVEPARPALAVRTVTVGRHLETASTPLELAFPPDLLPPRA
jgi:hypothetical protein